jgi:hypothetical protein
MGQIRTAKDGHRYSYRRTRSGRFYTIQHSPEGDKTNHIILLTLAGLVLAPFTYGLSLAITTLILVAICI